MDVYSLVNSIIKLLSRESIWMMAHYLEQKHKFHYSNLRNKNPRFSVLCRRDKKLLSVTLFKRDTAAKFLKVI